MWFRRGSHELHVGISDPLVSAVKAHPAFRVASVQELERPARRPEEAGRSVRWAHRGEIPGASRFFVDDPWGNRIELPAGGG